MVKVFNPKYLLYFPFDNMTSHYIYVKNTLQIKKINKKVSKNQFLLYNN